MKNAITKAAFELKTVCEKRSKNGGILHFVKTDFTSFPDFLLIGDILMPLLIVCNVLPLNSS